MAAIADTRILASQQLAFRNDFRGAIRQLATQLRGILIRAAGDDGELTFNEFNRVQSETGFAVMRFFAGPTGNAFTEHGEALAPFGELLNRHYAEAIWKAVKAQHDWMVRHVPQDLQKLMTSTVVRSPAILPATTVNALILRKAERLSAEREMRVREADEPSPAELRTHLRLFHPNPLAEIDPERLWVRVHEPRQIINDLGEVRPYRLSDAVWQAGDATRQQVNEVIRLGISQGRSAVDIAEKLEQYLLPRIRNQTTFNPYGVKYMGPEGVAHAAMRIARTEISRGFNQAAYTSALHNPWVDRIAWVLSPSHPKTDVCDTLAGIYPIRAAQIPPAHPYCICHTESIVADSARDIQAIAQDIRAQMETNRQELLAPVMTPLMINEFVASLIEKHLQRFTGIPTGYIPSSIVVPF
jgi:hypothetical protein